MTHHSEPAREAVKVPDLSIESAAAFLIVCAEYFERRPTDGEDAAHWANVSNGAMCRKIAAMLSASPAPAAGGLEAAVRRAKYLLDRIERDDGIGIGEFDTMLRMVIALAAPAATSEEPVAFMAYDRMRAITQRALDTVPETNGRRSNCKALYPTALYAAPPAPAESAQVKEGFVLISKDLLERAQHALSASTYSEDRCVAAEISASLATDAEG